MRGRHRRRRWMAAALFLAVFAASLWLTDCSPALFWRRRDHLTDLVFAMLPPDWGYLPRVLGPLLATIQMSVTGTVLGALLALLLAPACAGTLHGSAVPRKFIRAAVQVLRSFPVLILALAATFFFGLGAFAGMTAITAYTFAIMTRLTYEDIETAPMGPYRALCAMGAPPLAAFYRAVLPEVAASYLTNVLYLLETNVRHSAILGYVGAGGVGLLLNEKIAWLEYDKVASILLVLFAASLLIESLSRSLTALVQGERTASRRVRRLLLLGGAAVFAVCTLLLEPPDFAHTSLRTIRAMAAGLLRPDWAFFFRLDESGLPYLLLETVCIAVAGTCAGAVLALPLAFLNTARLVPRPLANLFRCLVTAIRSVPFLIYGLIFIRVTGPGAFTGVLTLAMCSVGLLTKRFTEAIESLDFRAFQALAAMGAPLPSRVRHALLPQLGAAFVSAVLYRFDVNIREASVLGLVGAGGIGAPLIFAMNKFDWPTAGAIALGLVLLVWLIDAGSRRLRQALG
jgi:phosphonate transport system permease protein